MKKNLTKKVALALALVLIAFNVFALSSCTSSSLPAGAVDWTLSDDFKTLTNETDGIEYELYDSNPSVFNHRQYAYVYCDVVCRDFAEGYYDESNVYTLTDNKDIVWLDFDGERYYYVTKDEKLKLDMLRNGQTGKCYIRGGADGKFRVASVPSSIINEANSDLKLNVNTEIIDSRILDNYNYYYIERFDSTKSISARYAVVFAKDDIDYLYVRLSDLSPNALDQYGMIDFSSGEMITLVHIRQETVSSLIKTINSGYMSTEVFYTYEIDQIPYNQDYYTEAVTSSMILFWVAVVVIGFIIPFPFFVLGCTLAFIKKLGRPKYWLTVAAFALLWMLFAALFSLIIILIILI